MSFLTTLFTGSYKIISPLHHYNKELTTDDVVLIVSNPYDSLYYIAINRNSQDVIVRNKVKYKSIIKDYISSIDATINFSSLVISNVSGVYSYNDDTNKTVATIFLILEHIDSKYNYMFQIDIINHNVNNARIIPIIEFFNKKHVYFDTVVTNNTTINDFKSLTNTDAYLTYINMDNKETLSMSNVEGILILVTTLEKEEYTTKYSLDALNLDYAYLDSLLRVPRIFFKLTDDTTKIKFNFSTGLGFLKFE